MDNKATSFKFYNSVKELQESGRLMAIFFQNNQDQKIKVIPFQTKNL